MAELPGIVGTERNNLVEGFDSSSGWLAGRPEGPAHPQDRCESDLRA